VRSGMLTRRDFERNMQNGVHLCMDWAVMLNIPQEEQRATILGSQINPKVFYPF